MWLKLFLLVLIPIASQVIAELIVQRGFPPPVPEGTNPPPVTEGENSGGISRETERPPPLPDQREIAIGQLIWEGKAYMTHAELTDNPRSRERYLDEAFQSFDSAVREARLAGGCSEMALMYRGLVRDRRAEPGLAEDDLNSAIGCRSSEFPVYYSRARYYSRHGEKLDLALRDMELAVNKGFSDCKADLANLRSDHTFGPRLLDMLENHKLFCLAYT